MKMGSTEINRLDKSVDQIEFDKAARLFLWCERWLSLMGLWPKKNRDVLFWTLFIYYGFYKILDGITLYIAAGKSLQYFIHSLAYNVTFIHVFLRFFVLKFYNTKYGELLEEISTDYNEELYKSPEEKNTFLEYNRKCKTFMNVVVTASCSASFLQYFKPFIHAVRTYVAQNANSTTPITPILPNGFYYPYKVNSLQTYALTYVSQFPFVVLNTLVNCGLDCVFYTLVFTLCGLYSALSYSIKDINCNNQSKDFNNVMEKYLRLLRISKDIEKSFSACLLIHFMLSSTLICIVLHEILVCHATGQVAGVIAYFITGLLNTIRLFCYCKVGDHLIMESSNLSNAFYSCNWYNMSASNQKRIIFCISRAQKPSCLVAGRFGAYSLPKFTDIMKTSMAYLSFLRNFL